MAHGFSLNYVFVFLFVALGIFFILISAMPGELIAMQPEYNAPNIKDKEVASYYSANNITMYAQSWSGYLTLGNMISNDSGLPNDNRVEVHFIADASNYLEFRHAYPSWLFGLWTDYHLMKVQEPYLSKIIGFSHPGVFMINPMDGYWIFKEELVALETSANSSIFVVACEHITENFVILPYNSSYATLEDSFNAGKIHVLSSYEIDFDAMKPSAWMLITQLLTFQSPDLGLPGDAGLIINYVMGVGIWAAIVLIFYTVITRVIPTIQGGLED
jgi:hypothetical protein